MKESVLKWISAAVLTAVFFWLVWALKELVLLLLVAYGIAYVIHPLLSFLEKYGIGRSLGFFLLTGVLIIVGTVLLSVILPPIVYQSRLLLESLPGYFSRLKESLPDLANQLRDYLPQSAGISKEKAFGFAKEWLPTITPATIKAIAVALTAGLLKGYSITLTVFNLFILPFIVYYFAVDFKEMHLSLLKLVPPPKREVVRETALEIDAVMRRYIKGQITVASILAVLYGLGLWILGIKFWFVLALVSGFGNIIPYLGFITGIVLSTTVALVANGGMWSVLGVWFVFIMVQALEGNFLTPRIIGDSVGLSPLVVLLSIIAGGMLFGIIGVLMAVPVVGSSKVLLRRWRSWMVL